MDFEWFNQLLAILCQFGDLLKNIWGWFVGIAPTIDGIFLSFITYYTFRLTVFPKKLKFINFKVRHSTFDGVSLEITLENRSLCPAVIESLDLIVGTKKIQFFSGECIVDGFKTAKIEMPHYSQIVSSDGPVNIDICSIGNISLLVKTTRGVQHIKYETISKIAHRRILKLEEKYDRTMVYRNCYGDRIVVPGVRYALSYIDNQGNNQVVFIHNSGTMSAAPFGYNRLPVEMVENETTIRNHFDKEFKKYNLSYHLETFKDPFLIENTSDKIDNTQSKKIDPVKKKKLSISATTLMLVLLFSLSLSLTWDIIKLIYPEHQFYRFFPLIQSACLAGYTWICIASTNDVYVFNDFVNAKPRRKNFINKLAHFSAGFIIGLPMFVMRLIDVIFNRGGAEKRRLYRENLKQKLNDFDTKPFIVRTFAIPASIMLTINILMAFHILPENWIPTVQNAIDALVSLVGLALVIVNAKHKQKP